MSGVRARKYVPAPRYAWVRSVAPQRAVRTTSTPDPGWPHPALCTRNKIRHRQPGVQTRPPPVAANGCITFAAAISGRALYLQRIAAGPKNPSREKCRSKIGYKQVGLRPCGCLDQTVLCLKPVTVRCFGQNAAVRASTARNESKSSWLSWLEENRQRGGLVRDGGAGRLS